MSLQTSLNTAGLAIGAVFQFLRANWLLLVICAVAFTVAGNWLGGWRSERKSAKTDTANAELQKQVDGLNAENTILANQRNEAIGRAQAAETQAALKEKQSEALNQLIDKSNAPIQAAQEKINDATKQLESDQVVTDADVPDAERRHRICTKYQSLGIPALRGIKCE